MKMRAAVFHGVNDIRVEEVERPRAGVGEAVICVTLTTICGTDLHILRGEYPVRPGLVIGHEPVGVVAESWARGHGLTRSVIACWSAPLRRADNVAGVSRVSCRSAAMVTGTKRSAAGASATRSMGRRPNTCWCRTRRPTWRRSPTGLRDEQVVLLADIASTGFSGAESGCVRIGDSVVVFAQGPIGLCATAGAKLMGATLIIGIDGDETRLAMARRMGADVVLDYRGVDVVAEVKRLTGGGADVAIEALGTQETFENALRCLRPGGRLSSLGVYAGKLQIPYDAFAAGLGDHRIVTTLCPGGKERMRRLMEVVSRPGGSRAASDSRLFARRHWRCVRAIR